MTHYLIVEKMCFVSGIGAFAYPLPYPFLYRMLLWRPAEMMVHHDLYHAWHE
jgi:hypothetical protein